MDPLTVCFEIFIWIFSIYLAGCLISVALGLTVGIWLRRHPEVIVKAPGLLGIYLRFLADLSLRNIIREYIRNENRQNFHYLKLQRLLSIENFYKMGYLSELLDQDSLVSEPLIAVQERLLQGFQPNKDPFYYAYLQINLGFAYFALPKGDHAENLARAIACFQEALRFLKPQKVPIRYRVDAPLYNAVAYSALGDIYRKLPAGDRAENLAQAIACCREALRACPPRYDYKVYAKIQSELGATYNELQTGDRAENLTRAIACFQEALRYQAPKMTPRDYAVTRAYLGGAYSHLPTGDPVLNQERALACYQDALHLCTPVTAPFECRWISRDLADLYLAQGEWHEALNAYRTAMDAGERLYRAGLSVEGRVMELANNAALYRNAAFTAARCGEIDEALLIQEHGRTRLLTEALRLRVPRPANVPDEVWTAFERAAEAVREAHTGIATVLPRLDKARNPAKIYKAQGRAVKRANTALDEAVERVRVHAPQFLRKIDLASIQALLPDERTVAVVLCIAKQGSLGFVVGHHFGQEVRLVEIPGFTHKELSSLLVEEHVDGDDKPASGWLGAYQSFLRNPTLTAFTSWQETIARTVAELGNHLLAPILSLLPRGTERIIFLPSAELFLLPLHAAALSSGDSELVCDRYQISYAPSFEVLSDIRERAVRQVTPDLYAVINPQDDPELFYTWAEGSSIAELFPLRQVDSGRVGTKQRVVAEVPTRTYVHFSCHGYYDWNEPGQSGLELANGRLTLAELQQNVIDLSAARLVTLSACETGISDIMKGSPEEYVGIPAGLLVAGVPCVVSSLWAVSDLSTALLMERFYRNHLNEEMNIAAALREAQLWVRELSVAEVARYAEQCYEQARQGEQAMLYRQMRYYRALSKQNPTLHPFAHPYYWAAFTVNGI